MSQQRDLVVVVGGSGFVGTRLCARLQDAGRSFLIIDKQTSKTFPDRCVIADVRNYKELLEAMPEASACINLAAEHRDDVFPRSLYSEVNVNGASNICNAISARGIDRLIFTSSVAVYGFALAGTDESGKINPFNDYGRTKAEAENIYEKWWQEKSDRSLTIIRPTVIFGERNRGNVFNLLNQINSGKFIMVGNGRNIKSMAYVENIAAFLEHALGFAPGINVLNYTDKPDFNMNELVSAARKKLNRGPGVGLRIPYLVGYAGGLFADLVSRLTNLRLPISSIRVKKFCATTQFDSKFSNTDFQAPVSLLEGLDRTLQYEFLEMHENEQVFHTE